MKHSGARHTVVFSSFLFLFGFLPILLGMYFLTPKRGRNFTLLLASLAFYGWGAPKILPLLLGTIGVDFFLAKAIKRAAGNLRLQRWLVAIGVTLNLSFLLYFKYSNFLFAELSNLLIQLGFDSILWSQVALPIGISFFTFQKISYLLDVYRGQVEPSESIIDYALYVTLFPQLIAGPIVRYHDIAAQLTSRNETTRDVFLGLHRFSLGLAKKVLLADAMGAVADNCFALSSQQLTFSYAWLGILAYAFQIYFDFSGYSDMAIGLARVFGFHLLENFNMPYTSRNFTEFWRRWHISLSNWMKEYLYIPLGGNRGSKGRTYLNLWTVFLLSGLWHGASWSFLIWGAYHGFFLAFDKAFWLKHSQRLPVIIQQLLTFLLVCIGWVFFRAENLSNAIDYLKAMFRFSEFWIPSASVMYGSVIHQRGEFVFLVCCLIILVQIFQKERITKRISNNLVSSPSSAIVVSFASFALLTLSILNLAAVRFTPFLYFRF